MPFDFADIYITVRGDWFTQDDTRRALWENCPYNGFQPVYTCSKKHDFASTFVHELGHAIGFVAQYGNDPELTISPANLERAGLRQPGWGVPQGGMCWRTLGRLLRAVIPAIGVAGGDTPVSDR